MKCKQTPAIKIISIFFQSSDNAILILKICCNKRYFYNEVCFATELIVCPHLTQPSLSKCKQTVFNWQWFDNFFLNKTNKEAFKEKNLNRIQFVLRRHLRGKMTFWVEIEKLALMRHLRRKEVFWEKSKGWKIGGFGKKIFFLFWFMSNWS